MILFLFGEKATENHPQIFFLLDSFLFQTPSNTRPQFLTKIKKYSKITTVHSYLSEANDKSQKKSQEKKLDFLAVLL